MLRLFISDGNIKIGKTPNVSLLPGVTCCKKAPCLRKCYALKGCKSYPGVIPAWAKNTLLWATDPDRFWELLGLWFRSQKSPPKYFRWFVGGDIPDATFYLRMIDFARRHPDTRFVSFTKQRFVVEFYPAAALPKNLRIWFSAWPGWGDEEIRFARKNKYRIAWYRPDSGADPRMPKQVLRCPGKCEKCRACWGNGSRDLCLYEH